MYPRGMRAAVRDALADSPVTLLVGARQTGKTTLARSLVGGDNPADYFTFDDATLLAAARSDPDGFVAGLGARPVILDEVQRTPELFSALKASVDRDRRAGRFLLTGSANVLMLPRLSESLAGRMEILTLWPLAQAEIDGRFETDPVAALFEGVSPPFAAAYPETDRDALLDRMLKGGFPEPLSRKSPARQRAWFTSYLTTILQRDVRDITNIDALNRLPRLLSLIAARSAGLLNMSDISSTADIPYATLHRYMAVLEATYLIQTLPAWSANIGTRLVKSPKIVVCDTGLLASLLLTDPRRLEADPNVLGMMLETFVAMELRKLCGWSTVPTMLFHFRTSARQEVDLVLESSGGEVVGIEVKAAGSVTSSDFKGLRALAEAAGPRFQRGLVLYRGGAVVPFGANLHAVPLSFLWS